MAAGFTVRLGTVEAVAALALEQADTLAAVRAEVTAIHPDATEAASVRERGASWGFGPAGMSGRYAYAMPHRAHADLGFFRGIHLPDPEGVLEGTGKVLRHVKLRGPEDARRPATLALLAAARDERRAALHSA